jgi:hypothetical protein
MTFCGTSFCIIWLATQMSQGQRHEGDEQARENEHRQQRASQTEEERQKDAETLQNYLSLTNFVEPRQAEPVSKAEIRSLIAELASPLPAPKIENGEAVFPEGSDRRAYRKAKGPWLRLQDAGLQAFPYLFECLNDDRYSFTDDAGESDNNWTVGRACFDVVRCQIEPWYHKQLPGANGSFYRLRPRYTNRFLHNPKAAEAWWETHKHLSIHDMQLEVLQWVIAEEAKMPDDYSSPEREYLNVLLTKLRSGTAIFPPWVPWSV